MARDPRELSGAWTRFQRIDHRAPPADLAPFVERFWLVEWNYPEPYRQKMLPHPRVHVTVRSDRPTEVHGVASGHITRVLHGSERMVGIAFRPGGFRAFLGASVSTLTDRTVPVTEIVGLGGGGPGEPDVDAVERWLRAVLPAADPAADEVAGTVALVAADRTIARVDQLADRRGCTVRQLQRQFAEYVGIGPKWVIRRYRLQEVTERMERGDTADWARVAAELGYADQAHLTREFTAMFGEPPTWYARRYASR